MSEREPEVALTPEHRRYVDEVYAHLDDLSYYDLLGIKRDADEQAVKRAYFALSRFIHPDRYYGKALGSYKPKLDAVFTRATKAYHTLTVAGLREAYDAALAKQMPAEVVPIDPVTAARRQAVLDALDKRTQDARARAAPHLAAAERARAAGDVIAAAAAYRKALDHLPNDPALEAACREMAVIASQRKADAYRRQAELAERQGRWEQAAGCWRHVVEAAPDDQESKTRLAEALVRLGK